MKQMMNKLFEQNKIEFGGEWKFYVGQNPQKPLFELNN
jgi:hypothetical protein